jgi:hypothetical protein
VFSTAGGRTAELERIFAYINQKAGLNLAQGFQAYAAQFPNQDPAKIYMGWLLGKVGAGLAPTIANAVGVSGGQAVGDLATGAGKGVGQFGQDVQSLSVVKFLGMLTERGTLQRLAEGFLGILLIVVGVAKIAEGTPLGNTLKKVPFV